MWPVVTRLVEYIILYAVLDNTLGIIKFHNNRSVGHKYFFFTSSWNRVRVISYPRPLCWAPALFRIEKYLQTYVRYSVEAAFVALDYLNAQNLVANLIGFL